MEEFCFEIANNFIPIIFEIKNVRFQRGRWVLLQNNLKFLPPNLRKDKMIDNKAGGFDSLISNYGRFKLRFTGGGFGGWS